jgi:hypothetical protein
MLPEQERRHCQRCKCKVLAERPATNHILHLLLTVATCGLWLFVWIGSVIKFGGWKCPVCGDSC